MLFIPVALSSTRMNWSSLMPWLITPLVSLPCRSLRFWLPCIRKVAEQHDRYQQEKEKKSGGAVAGSLGHSATANPRPGEGGRGHFRGADRTGLGCNPFCQQRFWEARASFYA